MPSSVGRNKLAIDNIKQHNPNLSIEVGRGLFDVLHNERINVERADGGVIHHLECSPSEPVRFQFRMPVPAFAAALAFPVAQELSLKSPKIL